MGRRLFLLMGAVCWAGATLHAQDHAGATRPDQPAGHGAVHAAAEDHGPSYELMSSDGLTALWTIIVFVVLLIILKATAWKPIQKVLNEREAFITRSLEQAKQDREAAEAKLREYVEKLNAARVEATAIVEEGRRDAEVTKRKIEETARTEATAMIDRARREISLAAETAVKELNARTAMLATQIAGRIIRVSLDAKEHERLIRDCITEFETVSKN